MTEDLQELGRRMHADRVKAALSPGSLLSEWWWVVKPRLERAATNHLTYLCNHEGEKERAKRLENQTRREIRLHGGGRTQGKTAARAKWREEADKLVQARDAVVE